MFVSDVLMICVDVDGCPVGRLTLYVYGKNSRPEGAEPPAHHVLRILRQSDLRLT
jgi:hypothetical protein